MEKLDLEEKPRRILKKEEPFEPLTIKGNGMVLHPKTKKILIQFVDGFYTIKDKANFEEIKSLCPKYLNG